MCRGKNICTELGTNPDNWDIYAPIRRPSWIDEQIDLFTSAVDDFFAGQKDSCLAKLSQIKSDEITYWYCEHGQMSGRHRRLALNIAVPPKISEDLRDPRRSPKIFQTEVFNRDGYRCRYCGSKLISQDFIKLFIKKIDSPLFQRGHNAATINGIIHITWPVADHVTPWNQGGRTDLTNLVSACAPCNYGKDGNTLEQLGLQNPLDREPVIDKWNGLTDKLTTSKKQLIADT